MNPTLTLRAGELTATLAPNVGGSIASFYSQRGSQQQHWLRPNNAPDPAMPWAMVQRPAIRGPPAEARWRSWCRR